MRWTASRLPLPTPASSELAPYDLSSARGAAVWPSALSRPATTRGRGHSAGACPWQERMSSQGRAVTSRDSLQLLLQDARLAQPGSWGKPHTSPDADSGAKVSMPFLQPRRARRTRARLTKRDYSSSRGYASSLTLVYVQGQEAENRAVRKP